jgi:CRISPR-associated endoribonuclease Cas6
MRATAQLNLKKPEVPADYRPAVLSLLKSGLTVYSNGQFFSEFYDGSAKTKPLCFSVGFPRGVKFQKDKVLLPAESTYIKVTFSSGDRKTGILLYNALRRTQGKSRPLADGNEMTLTKLYAPPEPVLNSTTQMLAKALSPICVRVKDGGKRQYASVAQPDFEEKLREQLARRFRDNSSITDEAIKTFHFFPVQAHKTVALHFGQKMECSVGTAVISGVPALLYEIYENGLGSRCSNGFGLLQILQQK